MRWTTGTAAYWSVAILNPAGGDNYSLLSYDANGYPTRLITCEAASGNPYYIEDRFYCESFTTGVARPRSLQALDLAPNPATGMIRLNNKLPGHFRIVDAAGRLLMEGNADASAAIGTGSLVPGTYRILLDDRSGTGFSGRFVKR